MKKALIFLSIILTITLFIYILFFSKFFKVNNFDVTGTKFSNLKVKSILKEYENKNIFLLRRGELRDKLLKSEYIESLIIEKKYPNTISISINERKAVGQIELDSKYIVISNEDVVIDVLDKRKESLPLFKGFNASEYEKGKLITVKPVLMLEKAKKLSLLLKMTDIFDGEVTYKNNSLIFYINKEYYVDFGKKGDISNKFTLFMSVYENLKKQKVNKGVIKIYNNNSVIYQPFIEKKKEDKNNKKQ